MAAKGSSARWLKEHFSDTYVKQAKKSGFRSRAVYKLLELQQRDHLFKPGMVIVDLGAAPGGWSQLAANEVKQNGRVIAVDLLPMEAIAGVELVQGDFSDELILKKLLSLAHDRKIDWVISDMAPNLSGNASVDVPRTLYLAELALDFALKILTTGGGMLVKVFQGTGVDLFIKEMKHHFISVTVRKPAASRGRSREVYILAKEFTVRNKHL